MRIRQVRPEFFTDPVTARMSASVQVIYIGLWCIADDAGWLTWDVANIGALLRPYQSVRVREKAVTEAGAALAELGRLVIEPCNCAFIPKLVAHQKIGGNKSFTGRDKHREHTVHTSTDLYPGKVGNGRVSTGRVSNGIAAPALSERGAPGGLGEKLVAAGMKPAIVKASAS